MKPSAFVFFLCFFLAGFNCRAQTELPRYNGKVIPLNIDSFESGYFKIETPRTLEIQYWYLIEKDTFLKVYWYSDTALQKIKFKSLAKYRPPIQHRYWYITNLDYFGMQTYFTDKGIKRSEKYIENGKLNGTYNFYYKSGEIKEKCKFKEDKLIGDWVSYNKKGVAKIHHHK